MEAYVRSRRLRRAAAFVTSVTLAVSGCSSGTSTRSVGSSSGSASSTSSGATPNPVLDRLSADGLRAHLIELDSIADQNGGNRAVGSPGFDASVEYAAKQLSTFGYTVVRQEFQVPVFTDPGGSELVVVGGSAGQFRDGIDFLTFTNSVAAEVHGPLVAVSEPCATTGFSGVSQGSVVLIFASDGCQFDIRAPELDGAVAIILAYAWPDGQMARPMLPEGYVTIPALTTTEAAGVALKAVAGATVRVRTTGQITRVTTQNLLAEREGSDSGRVLVFGAHLDSVPGSPGMDDDASGVAAVLEIARVFADARPVATIRYALWSAEELGMLGSRHYVEVLSSEETKRVEAYLSADMIAAKNGIRGVYMGSAELPRAIDASRRLTAYFVDRGLKVDAAPGLWNRTDAAAFSEGGIAAVGLISFVDGAKTAAEAATFGGTAGQPHDPCYHLACDTIDNVDLALLHEMTAAYATAILDLAFSNGPIAGE